jgi:hypothetical protein
MAPPATACPLMAQMTGTGKRRILWILLFIYAISRRMKLEREALCFDFF